MGLLECPLELVQLVGREGGPVAPVLLLTPVAVYVVPAARAELLVAATAGGVAAVLTWRERERRAARRSGGEGGDQVSPRKRSLYGGNRGGNGDRFIRSRSYYPHYPRIIVAIRSAASRGTDRTLENARARMRERALERRFPFSISADETEREEARINSSLTVA